MFWSFVTDNLTQSLFQTLSLFQKNKSISVHSPCKNMQLRYNFFSSNLFFCWFLLFPLKKIYPLSSSYVSCVKVKLLYFFLKKRKYRFFLLSSPHTTSSCPPPSSSKKKKLLNLLTKNFFSPLAPPCTSCTSSSSWNKKKHRKFNEVSKKLEKSVFQMIDDTSRAFSLPSTKKKKTQRMSPLSLVSSPFFLTRHPPHSLLKLYIKLKKHTQF